MPINYAINFKLNQRETYVKAPKMAANPIINKTMLNKYVLYDEKLFHFQNCLIKFG